VRSNFLGSGVFVVVLVALLAQFQAIQKPSTSTAVLALRDSDDGYRFFVDELPDGRYHYTAQLVGMPFPVSDQEERGILTSREWNELTHLLEAAPTPSPSPAFEVVEPNAKWGTLDSSDCRRVLCNRDWATLERTKVGAVYWRLVFEAKRSI